jgi:hypothetical protein
MPHANKIIFLATCAKVLTDFKYMRLLRSKYEIVGMNPVRGIVLFLNICVLAPGRSTFQEFFQNLKKFTFSKVDSE